jgi:hypothetical protein
VAAGFAATFLIWVLVSAFLTAIELAIFGHGIFFCYFALALATGTA